MTDYKHEVINVVILGLGGVGKTCISLQFVKGEFTDNYLPTVEDEFEKEVVVDGKTYLINIVDTAGQEDFRDFRFRMINSGDCFLFVYSVENESSLNYIQEIYDDVLASKKMLPPTLILGNKCDLPEPFVVTKGEAKATSKQKWGGIKIIETSAKTGKNINEAFERLIRMFKKFNNSQNNISDEKESCCMLQ